MATTDEREAFGSAVRTTFAGTGRSQSWLAAKAGEEMGRDPISQPYVSEIMNGIKEPSPELAFALERALGVRPGTFTRHLGYLPADARSAVSVLDAIEADPKLSDMGRSVLRAAYRELVR